MICEAAGPSGSDCSVTAVSLVTSLPAASLTGLPSASLTVSVCVVACSSGTLSYGLKFCGTPCETSTSAPTSDSGSSTYSVARVMSTQKLPTPCGVAAHEAADQRDQHGDAGRRRQEVLHGEPEHLRQIAHRRLAAVALPVRVRGEADRGVHRRIGADRAEALRIQRQPLLHALQEVDDEKAGDVEHEHRQRVALPAHVLVRHRCRRRDRAGARPDRRCDARGSARPRRRAPCRCRAA